MEEEKTTSSLYDTLVLSGSSVKGITFLGALQYLYDNSLIKDVKTFVGTSSGAMISYLLIIGYTPIEIFVYICTHQILDRMQHFNIVAMIQGSGATSFNSIHELLEKMTIDKIGYLPTIEDLETRFGKKLICVTHNLTEDKTEYISAETHPKIPCLTALHMSANLPLIFEKFKYGHSFYIDGGISDNFAIQIGEELGTNILGINLVYTTDELSDYTDADTVEYIYKLMFIPVCQSIKYKLGQISDKCRVISLYSNIAAQKFFDFNIKSSTKMDMFTDGYQQLKEHFKS
tara:strand:+ start:209 stop:1072 length:864 start_codon:yes stop_codon:yes gene_type:complete